jgi:hypothetical protein
MHEMDDGRSVQALHQTGHSHSHVAMPSVFSGKREEYHGFRRQLGLYLTENRQDFKTDESMVIFTLSYMKEGSAARWADMFVDRALEDDNWGTYPDFLNRIAKDFGDKEEPRKALEQMNRLNQGKGMASEYFQKLEQLALTTGININRTPHILLQMERGLNGALVDQLYFSRAVPSNYRDYKQCIVDVDDMRKRQEANRS